MGAILRNLLYRDSLYRSLSIPTFDILVLKSLQNADVFIA